MRLLLIEDHERFASFVKRGLVREGFTVDAFETLGERVAALDAVSCYTGRSRPRTARRGRPDLAARPA